MGYLLNRRAAGLTRHDSHFIVTTYVRVGRYYAVGIRDRNIIGLVLVQGSGGAETRAPCFGGRFANDDQVLDHRNTVCTRAHVGLKTELNKIYLRCTDFIHVSMTYQVPGIF